jgi:hypothetical protein
MITHHHRDIFYVKGGGPRTERTGSISKWSENSTHFLGKIDF